MSLFISPEAAPARVGKSQTKEIQERYRTYRLRKMYIPREMESISIGPSYLQKEDDAGRHGCKTKFKTTDSSLPPLLNVTR